MQRRNFIKKTMAGSAATILVPTILPSNVFGQTHANKKINIGQIGCGRIARDHDMPGVMQYDSARLIAVCDVDSNRAQDAKTLVQSYYAKKTGSDKAVDVKVYGDYRELLMNPDIDAVVISTPDHWHSQPAIEAALAGKDVYLQKPTSLTLEEGRILVDIIKKKGTILQVGTQQRAMPQFRIAAELVRNGRIGKIHTVKVGLPGDPAGPEAAEMPIPSNLNFKPEDFDYFESFEEEVETRKQGEYLKWCGDNRLFINDLNDVCVSEIVYQDIMTLPSFSQQINFALSMHEELMYHGNFDELKNDFCYARYLIFSARNIPSDHTHFFNKTYPHVDDMSHSITNLKASHYKSAFRTLYSLFDKIAYFINRFFDLNDIKYDHKISFDSIFSELKGSKSWKPHSKLKDSQNCFIHALFYILKDIRDVKDSTSVSRWLDPDAKAFSEIRNAMHGNICRCAAYNSIEEAVKIASKK